MQIPVSKAVLTPEGVPYDKAPGSKQPATAGWLCVKALLDCDSSQKTEGKEKFDRALLARKLVDAQESVELSAEEIVKIKACVGEAYGPWIVMQVWNALEGKE